MIGMSFVAQTVVKNALKKYSFGLAVLIAAWSAIAVADTRVDTPESDGFELNLSDYRLTFHDDFDALSVSPWGPKSRWIAHLPWGGHFGDAKFVDPAPKFPHTVKNGKLRIEIRKGKDGKWRSGLLASVDPKGNGFSQKFGYFEIRAKLPRGKGLWPAFWLIGQNRLVDKNFTAEIDVIEHVGQFPGRFSSAVHVWDRKDRKKSRSVHKRTPVVAGSLYDRFNTYGVHIDETWIRVFFNRKEVWRTQTPPEHRQAMFVLVNLGLGSGFPTDETPSPSFMHVDYVKAWALPKS